MKASPEPLAAEGASHSLALARSRAYRLFADLLLESPNEETRSILANIPELVDVLNPDPEGAAADHYHLFGLNVFPYQSAFLEPDGILGGEVTDSVRAFFGKAGFSPHNLMVENPDHAGMELLLLSNLCASEAEALEEGLGLHAEQAVRRQAQLLNQFLLLWYPGFVQAIRSQGLPFYTAIGELSLELILDHHRSLPVDLNCHEIEVALPPVPDLLDRTKTGLKEIAAYLLTPVYSGLYLSRDDINRLARPLRLPHGFGPRQQTLTNLMGAAADYGLLSDLLAEIGLKVMEWDEAYRRLYDQAPATTKILSAWLDRLQRTSGILHRISAGAAGPE